VNFFRFPFHQLDQHIGDKAKRNARCNAVSEGHESNGDERNRSVLKIVPVDIGDGGDHENTDNDQRRRRRGGGNNADDRRKDEAQGEHNRRHNGGKARAAAFRDACGAFNKSRGVGSTDKGARDGCAKIGKQRTVQTRFDAAAGIHQLFVFFVENAGAAAGSDEGSQRVENIGQNKTDQSRKHKRKFRMIREQAGEIQFESRVLNGRNGGSDGLRSDGNRAEKCGSSIDVLRQRREKRVRIHAAGDFNHADERRGNDADQDGALNVQHHQHQNNGYADQRQLYGGAGKIHEGRNGGSVGDHGGIGRRLPGQDVRAGIRCEFEEARILNADVGDKQSNASADRALQHPRQRAKNNFAETRDRDDDVHDAADKHHGKRLFPGELHDAADGERKERIKSHARRQSVRHVREQSHNQRAHDRSDDRSNKNALRIERVVLRPGERKDARVDENDVRHGEEGGNTRDNFRADIGAVALEVKKVSLGMVCRLCVFGHIYFPPAIKNCPAFRVGLHCFYINYIELISRKQ